MRLILLFLSFSLVVQAEEEAKRLSEALGHLIGKNIEQLGLPIDLNALAKGMQDEATGKESPLNEEACTEGIAALKEKKMEEIAAKNLEEANAFLAKNAKSSIQLVEGKLQYKIEKEGTGEAVETYNRPIVRFTVQDAHGKPFGVSHGEESIDLDEAIPGFRLGLAGMKEGEIRTLYVHPELAYGKQGPSPNALLIFKIELIHAETVAEKPLADTPLDLESLPYLR
jgi:peptidylprolyl isomerase